MTHARLHFGREFGDFMPLDAIEMVTVKRGADVLAGISVVLHRAGGRRLHRLALAHGRLLSRQCWCNKVGHAVTFRHGGRRRCVGPVLDMARAHDDI